ncbi:MAG: hypothetical protein ABFD20_07620 [Anaerolineales bacterium]
MSAPLVLTEHDLTTLVRATVAPEATVWLQDGRLYLQSSTTVAEGWLLTATFTAERPGLRLETLSWRGRALPATLRWLAQEAANAAIVDMLLPTRLTGMWAHAGELYLSVTP